MMTVPAAQKETAKAARWPSSSVSNPGRDRHDAAEAECDRQPAPPADLLAEKEDREDGRDRGRQEDEGIGLGKGQGGEGIDAENTGDAAGQAAQRHQPRPAHVNRVAPALVARLQEQQHQGREQGGEKADLEHWQMSAQRLHVGVAARKQEVREEA